MGFIKDLGDRISGRHAENMQQQKLAADKQENDAQRDAKAKADFEWGNDGKPTGIASDEEFEEIQRQIWGEPIYFLKKEKSARKKSNLSSSKKAYQ